MPEVDTDAPPSTGQDATAGAVREGGGAEFVPPEADAEQGAPADPGEPPTVARQPPENVSFDTARRLDPDGSRTLQDELSAEQVDFFVFAAKAGAYYEITTDRHPFSPDNVIAVYDDARQLVAENDEGSRWPGDGIDARLIVRADHTGDYFVRVEDLWTPPAFFESSFSLLYYHPSVRELAPTARGVGIAEQGPVAVEFTTDEATGYAYATVLGEAGAEPDVFVLDFAGEQALIGRVLSTETPAVSAIWDQVQYVNGDDVVIAQISGALGQQALHPPCARARYEVRVTTHGEAAAGDDFYAIDLVAIPENPPEEDDLGNGSAEGAEPLAMSEERLRRGLLLATLPPGDVDHFSFEVAGGDSALVVCEAESGGSQVRGLHAELLAPDLTPIGQSEETATNNLEIRALEIPESGTYFVRLSAQTPAVTPEAAWTRCAVSVGQ